MNSPQSPELFEPEKLRAELHSKINDLTPGELWSVSRQLQQLEIDRLAREIGERFGELEAQGLMTDDRIESAIAEHRNRHPYR